MSRKSLPYAATTIACYIGYVTQAIVINLPPLFFMIFQNSYGLSYEKLARLVLITFAVQIFADLSSVRLQKHFSVRTLSVTAHLLSTVGLVLLGILPRIMPNAYAALVICTLLYSYGGGMIEVFITPLIDVIVKNGLNGSVKTSIPLLHSFYCWGHMMVVLLSTVFFAFTGGEGWFILPMLWATVPLANGILFLLVPIPLQADTDTASNVRGLFGFRFFIPALLLMFSAGASEQAIAQWASLFAEKSLGVSKTLGDLLGPMTFAAMMGIVRAVCGVRTDRMNIRRALCLSAGLCVASYLLIVFSPSPALSLAGCTICGIAVALMWPGVLSLASREIPQGGTAMFGLLAFCGDIGCSVGPWVTGIVSDTVETRGLAENGLKSGILAAIVFPLMMLLVLLFTRKNEKKKNETQS